MGAGHTTTTDVPEDEDPLRSGFTTGGPPASKADRVDHCLVLKLMYGLTTDGLTYDAPRRGGRKIQ